MGIEPFLVASGVECVVAQRLVRRLCECKTPVKLSKEVLAENGFDEPRAASAPSSPAAACAAAAPATRAASASTRCCAMTDEVRRLILDKALAATS